jgi:hypothetical protein
MTTQTWKDQVALCSAETATPVLALWVGQTVTVPNADALPRPTCVPIESLGIDPFGKAWR